MSASTPPRRTSPPLTRHGGASRARSGTSRRRRRARARASTTRASPASPRTLLSCATRTSPRRTTPSRATSETNRLPNLSSTCTRACGPCARRSASPRKTNRRARAPATRTDTPRRARVRSRVRVQPPPTRRRRRTVPLRASLLRRARGATPPTRRRRFVSPRGCERSRGRSNRGAARTRTSRGRVRRRVGMSRVRRRALRRRRRWTHAGVHRARRLHRRTGCGSGHRRGGDGIGGDDRGGDDRGGDDRGGDRRLVIPRREFPGRLRARRAAQRHLLGRRQQRLRRRPAG